MKNTTTSKVIRSRSGSAIVRRRNGRFMKVDGISRQNHRRYTDSGEFMTEDGRRYTLVPVVKVLVDGHWTTKF